MGCKFFYVSKKHEILIQPETRGNIAAIGRARNVEPYQTRYCKIREAV